MADSGEKEGEIIRKKVWDRTAKGIPEPASMNNPRAFQLTHSLRKYLGGTAYASGIVLTTGDSSE